MQNSGPATRLDPKFRPDRFFFCKAQIKDAELMLGSWEATSDYCLYAARIRAELEEYSLLLMPGPPVLVQWRSGLKHDF